MSNVELNGELRDKVSCIYRKDKNKIERLADRCNANGFSCLAGQGDLVRLAVCLRYAEKYTLPMYRSKGIPMSVFCDTMADIDIWCGNNHNRGLRNYNWIKNHLDCTLFKLGRLQFQLYTACSKLLDYDHLPYNYGDNVLNIHIPQGEPLDYSACVDSINRAKEFFAQYFPDFGYRFMLCESWLLFEDNYMFMEPGSNILQFQSLFEIVFSAQQDFQAVERIFGKRRLLKSKYPTDTSLRRNALEYMKSGHKMGMGIGIIDTVDEKEEIAKHDIKAYL